MNCVEYIVVLYIIYGGSGKLKVIFEIKEIAIVCDLFE